jgi:hypothetical protein
MRALLILLVSLGVVAAAHAADALAGRIVKVLPLLVDLHGRTALSPSLFDRDAYQAVLREQMTNVSAVRFDVLWKAAPAPDEKIRITVELRGIGTNSIPTLQTLETNVVPGKFRKWTAVPLAGDDYQRCGRVVAWRVTLWNGEQKLGTQNSFLW